MHAPLILTKDLLLKSDFKKWVLECDNNEIIGDTCMGCINVHVELFTTCFISGLDDNRVLLPLWASTFVTRVDNYGVNNLGYTPITAQ